MMEDLISIIVPIYKVEKYLRKCIDSILAQTYANIEVILVDDGSPDRCGAIADEYAAKDSRVRVIHKENGGLSSARNAGVDIAKGEYIGFVDSDDYIHPVMYEKLYTAVKTSASDMAVCDYVCVHEDGTLCGHQYFFGRIPTGILTREEAFTGSQFILSPTAWNKLYRKALLQAVRFPEGKVHEDEFTAHHFYGQCNKIACMQDVLYYCVEREGSITSQFEMKNLDSIDAFIDRYFFALKNGYEILAAKTCPIILHALVNSMRKIRGRKMFFRWLSLLARYIFLMVRKPKMGLYTISDTVHYARKYLAWLSVRTALKKTKKIKKRVFLIAMHDDLKYRMAACTEYKIMGNYGFSKKNIIEIPGAVYQKYYCPIQQFVRKEDLLLINGNEESGTLWPTGDDMADDIIFRYKNNNIIAFPQTSYYVDGSMQQLKRNKEIYATASKLVLAYEDKFSYDYAKSHFPKTRCIYVQEAAK